MVSRIETSFQLRLTLSELFEAPTVAGLSLLIAERMAQAQLDQVAVLLEELEAASDTDSRCGEPIEST